uniref:tRNA dimethylallyltransferase, mitochondrial n=1 Tax=Cacopsylla melanoneura TaxID=428564 RepID=A0A8D8SQI6_9HEMI
MKTLKSALLKAVMSKVPIFVILGSTGTGKSKLGIELAKKFNGEVISADSMQVYKGLDVITNKVTEEEAEGIPHHMLNFLDPNTRFTVVDYRNQALRHIDDIVRRNKVPIIVGGTNYYIESLLWSILIDNKTNINDQGQFTLYDVDKIRNLEHRGSSDVLEALWRMDNDVNATNQQLFKDEQYAEMAGIKADDDVAVEHGNEHHKHDGRALRDDTERESLVGDKRKNVPESVDHQAVKKFKTDNNEELANDTKTSGEFSPMEGSQAVSDLNKNVKKENNEPKSEHMISETTSQRSGSESESKPTVKHKMELNKDDANSAIRMQKTSDKELKGHDDSVISVPFTAGNREGIKSVVSILDTFRSKMIGDIETANRVSRLKDAMRSPEETGYEKMKLRFGSVKEMFEELDKLVDRYKDVEHDQKESTRETATNEEEKDEAPPSSNNITSVYSSYKTACTHLTEVFRQAVLLPKHFLHTLSIHQAAKPMTEKMALYGLTGEDVTQHVELLRGVVEALEREVETRLRNKTDEPRTATIASSTTPADMNQSEYTIHFSNQLATLLTQYESHIGSLHEWICSRLNKLDNTGNHDVASDLASMTSHLTRITNSISQRPLISKTRYYLPTDTERTNLTTSMLHAMLAEVDPSTADNLHPKNIRKVVRALQVFYEHGRTLHDILTEQKALQGGSQLGGPLRFPNTVILWLQCEKNVLDKRLEGRVHTMIENGLIQELLDFHKQYNEERIKQQLEPDYTKGIFQSIGFKEFHPYLTLSETERNSPLGETVFSKSRDLLVLANVQYAKRQTQWVRNRLLKCPDRVVPPVYSLNCTDLNQWSDCVSKPAHDIVDTYLNNRTKPAQGIEPLPVEYSDPDYYKAGTFRCDDCNRVFVGQHQYEEHMSSSKHRRVKAKLERDLQLAMGINPWQHNRLSKRQRRILAASKTGKSGEKIAHDEKIAHLEKLAHSTSDNISQSQGTADKTSACETSGS